MTQERGGPLVPHRKIEEDPNYLAFKEQEEDLKRDHMNEFVAFVDGKLVLTNKDFKALFDEINSKYPRTGVFVHQVVEVEPIIDIPSVLEVQDIDQ
jgi:hypothetical protein